MTERQLSHGFDFKEFYISRVRRIFPLVFVVTVFYTIISFIIHTPDKLIKFGESLIAIVAFVPNLYFWRHCCC